MTLFVRNIFDNNCVAAIELSRKLTHKELENIKNEIESNTDEEPDFEKILYEAIMIFAPSAIDEREDNIQALDIQL